ncbi:uncharacterized protein A4U43_C07F10280 [Asparagus officinalis]|uniref:Uncharacterized protein n=1 Tax=Asparagus officinalis TaxID=4686 RepID=A0A5P1EB54_ASPOF|nr:uncharacterized protein A4U43_C07F10280 [Asparagus officinalis]
MSRPKRRRVSSPVRRRDGGSIFDASFWVVFAFRIAETEGGFLWRGALALQSCKAGEREMICGRRDCVVNRSLANFLRGGEGCLYMRGFRLSVRGKRAKPTITLRPTASFSAYHDFMRNLVMRMGPRYFAAYEDSVFRHYVQFGPPGVDLSTFEHILSQWDKKSKKFVFTDRNDGEEIACSFNLEWLWYYELTGIKKPVVGYTPGIVGGIDIQYEGDVNQSLFDEANKESNDPPIGRASPQLFFSDIHKESEDAPPGEVPPPEAYRIGKALEAEINEGEKVSPPVKELLTCTETCTQREGTGRKITPVVDVPSVGHDTKTQTCIG